uniref:NHS like 1 n=1 Tax=Aotus nancymaae TaxID=37293 RepID=A0A2K5ELR6_AOTNA
MVVFINAKIKSFIKLFKKKTVSNLDEESRWTVHYTAPWHQQENVFLPTTRPPCVEDLHRQAKLNLKSVLRECDKLRHDGYRSSQYYSQGPTFAANASSLCDDYQDEDEETDQKCSLSSSEEERFISIRRPKTPTSNDFSDLNTQTNWTKSLPLPTPEEKMRQQAQTVQADVVPINITGENFDRQASLRRSLIYTDTLVRRPKKVKRRKTITGVPDNIQKELASGISQDDVGGHSIYTPDHYSTLGRFDSYQSAGQRSETRDSSCQTEDMKVVPPSMRRIRAQKGQGIAAQMGHFSGSSGNMSVLSDSAGIVFPSRLDSDAGFHSLPRSGARANIQSLEPRLGPLGPAGDMDGTFPYQRGHPQADENSGHLGGTSRTGTLLRPKSQELRHFESENVTSPACVVSPHAAYSTTIIPNATLSSSSEVIAIHTAQSAGQLESRSSGSLHAKIKSRDHLISRHAVKGDHQSPGHHWNEGHTTILSQALDPHSSGAPTLLSLCDSAVSLSAPANRENGSQAMPYNCRNNLAFPAHPQDVDGKSESSYSGGGGHSSSEPWEYKASGNGRASPLKPHLATPGYSTPTSNMSSCSLDQTSNKEDAGSLYSEDHDGYCTSLHTDSGHGSGNLCNSSDGFGNPRHSVVNVFDGRAQKNQGDRSNYQDKSPEEARVAARPPRAPAVTWKSPGCPAPGARAQSCWQQHDFCHHPQCHSLCGSVKSEYTDPWDPGNPAGGCSTAGAPTGNGASRHVQEGSRATMPQVPSASVKQRSCTGEVTQSHFSIQWYSSQSNTPTALTPVPVFLKSVSPANGKGKPKPKVPERKSWIQLWALPCSSSSCSLSSIPCPADRSPFLLPHLLLQTVPRASSASLSCVPPSAARSSHCFLLPPDFPLLPDSPVSLPLPHLSYLPWNPHPPHLLDPKFMKDTRPSFTNSGQPESRGSLRPPATKEETSQALMALITTEALQMVQLRPVRKNSGAEAAPLSEQTLRKQRTPVAPQYHLKPSAFLKSRNSTNEMESESQSASVTSSLPTPAKSSSQGDHGSAAERSSLGALSAGGGRGSAPQPQPPPPPRLFTQQEATPHSKKPKLFLVVPPPQKDFAVEPAENVSEALRAAPSPTRGEEGSVYSKEAKESSAAQAGSHATHPGTLVLEGGAAGSVSSGRVEANVPMVQPNVSPAPKQEDPAENSADAGGDGESCLSQQDGAAGVPEASAACSFSEACDFLKEDGSDEVMTPSRPRTTEDLFAAIHRSKRKVLGRRDSDDDHSRNHSPSPPVTPTGAAPSLASPKQVGSIQRSIRKSSTSSDNFKALLLKKGSRSDTSARMSAAEMLKNTDPRFQRSRSEPSPDAPESPSSCSPSKNRRAQEEWAKNEGLMPRSLSFSGPRYGRSRTPPSAASSRYSLRNRIQSSPMTVISEGEGEAMEPVDSRGCGALGAAEGCSLNGLAREEVGEGGLLCGEGPAASLQPPALRPVDGTAGAEGRAPSPQCGRSLSEES